jgi:hypothetical protein
MKKLLKILSILFLILTCMAQAMDVQLKTNLTDMPPEVIANIIRCCGDNQQSEENQIKNLIRLKFVCKNFNESITPEFIQYCKQFKLDHQLFEAAKKNQVDYARILFTMGADPNAQDDQGSTPLYSAVSHSFAVSPSGMIQLLIEHGADMYHENKNMPKYYGVIGTWLFDDTYLFTCRDNTPIGLANKHAWQGSTSLRTMLITKYGKDLAAVTLGAMAGALVSGASNGCTIL